MWNSLPANVISAPINSCTTKKSLDDLWTTTRYGLSHRPMASILILHVCCTVFYMQLYCYFYFTWMHPYLQPCCFWRQIMVTRSIFHLVSTKSTLFRRDCTLDCNMLDCKKFCHACTCHCAKCSCTNFACTLFFKMWGYSYIYISF